MIIIIKLNSKILKKKKKNVPQILIIFKQIKKIYIYIYINFYDYYYYYYPNMFMKKEIKIKFTFKYATINGFLILLFFIEIYFSHVENSLHILKLRSREGERERPPNYDPHIYLSV